VIWCYIDHHDQSINPLKEKCNESLTLLYESITYGLIVNAEGESCCSPNKV
jgi:hypothetical protein